MKYHNNEILIEWNALLAYHKNYSNLIIEETTGVKRLKKSQLKHCSFCILRNFSEHIIIQGKTKNHYKFTKSKIFFYWKNVKFSVLIDIVTKRWYLKKYEHCK